MVLASLRGSAFIAVLLCAGAAAQSVQILCVYLLQNEYTLGAEFGARLGAVVALVVLTVIFCLIFWLLKVVRQSSAASGTSDKESYRLQ
jgi:ABC-type sugar transport system permease subunit